MGFTRDTRSGLYFVKRIHLIFFSPTKTFSTWPDSMSARMALGTDRRWRSPASDFQPYDISMRPKGVQGLAYEQRQQIFGPEQMVGQAWVIEKFQQSLSEDETIHQLFFGKFRECQTPVARGCRTWSDGWVVCFICFDRACHAELRFGYGCSHACFCRSIVLVLTEEGVKDEQIGQSGMYNGGNFRTDVSPDLLEWLTKDPRSSTPSCSGAYSPDSILPEVRVQRQ